MNKPEESKPAPKPERERSGLKTALISIAVALALICAAGAGLGIYVNSSDAIFPRVFLFDVSVGNLTETQAADKLAELGWDETDGAVTVLLPLGRSLTVKAADVGADVSSSEAAAAAYGFCHGGGAVQNLITWLRCAIAGAEINVVPNMDEAAVGAAVEDEISQLTEGLMSSGMDITDSAVLVVKGASSVTVDTDQLRTLIVDALRQRSYGQVEYEVQVGEAEPLDIDELYENVYCEPADAVYDAKEGGVVEAVVGRDFDKDAAMRLWEAAEYGDTVEIPLKVTEPELTTEELEDMLFRDELGSCKTLLYGSTQNRIDNVTLASDLINGVVLEPGETFSYNGTLGKRTAERGFKYAAAYSGGQVVQEIGGGICQVSSTLYNSVLLANLEIADRSCHFFPVGYLPPGLDATVSWKVPDFKFTNSRDYPIRIESAVNTEDNTLVITVMGTNVDGSYVEMTYASWAVYNNAEYPEVATGYKAATYRNIFDKNGELISHELEAYSEYHYHEEDLEFPSPSPSEPAPAVTATPPAVTDTPPEASVPPVQDPAQTTPEATAAVQ